MEPGTHHDESTAEEPSSTEEVSPANAIVVFDEEKPTLPAVTVVQQYERILPGSAERIIDMFEREIRARNDLLREEIRSEQRARRLGYILGFLALACTNGLGAWFLLSGHVSAAALVILSMAASIIASAVSAWIRSRLDRKGSQDGD